MERIILVTGATGKQGGAVARCLLKHGWQVRALTRSPGKDEAMALQSGGAKVIKGDLGDPASVRIALKGVYGVFSVQNSWEHGVEKEMKQGMTLADEAKKANVAHFIYSSVGSAHRNTGIPHFESKWQIEKHIRSTGLMSTILRPAFFMENMLSPDTLPSIMNGILPLGLNPEKPLQMIAVDDIGAFATLAFEDPDEYIGKEIDIAGDEHTGPQMAEILEMVLERDFAYRQTPLEQIRAFSDDYAKMVEWFNALGYIADIKALRAIHPDLMTFEKWVKNKKTLLTAEEVAA
jgi:uncharacterized protein YbjT (DUF2867 family)